jgi:hypothetical protein
MALPSPTALVATVPYTKFTTTAHIWVPTIASMAAPTLAEFNAGKLLTPEITAVTGFDTQVAELSNPKAGTSFAGTLPGRETPNASSIEFELSTAGPTVDARSVFSKNQLGYVVICNEGIVTGGYCDIFPVRVGAPAIPQDLEQIAKIMVDFHIYKTPQLYVAIPTA